MLLDFVLTHPGLEWYATEPDKIDLFVHRFGVPESVVPKRAHTPPGQHWLPAAGATRFWVLPLPIFVHGTPPSVNFVTVVTNRHASAIGTFVREHVPLVRHLTGWSLHAVIPQGASTEAACATAYQRALAAASLESVAKEDLDWVNRTRQFVLQGDLRELAVADLKRYRELAGTLGRRLDTRTDAPLALHWLPHSYSQFGSFAGDA